MSLTEPTTRPETELIVHFGYHKAMTMLFKQLLAAMAEQLHWYYRHHNSDRQGFYEDAIRLSQCRVVSVNNVPIQLDRLTAFVGSHVIRDPRDLLVSGYRYHLWCNEEWATRTLNPSLLRRLDLDKLGLANRAEGLSLQSLLKSVDRVSGLMIELNWRRAHFRQMEQWDYENPHLIELKYEEIFGNESREFAKLFSHFGLSQDDIEPLLKLVDRLSFRRLLQIRQTGPQKHASVGDIGQWKTFLPATIKETFKHRHGQLLVRLGYESDLNWN